MNLNALIPLAALAAYAVLLIVIWRHRPRNRVKRAFAVYLLAMTIWSLGSFLLHANPPIQTPFFWWVILSGGALAMPVLFFYFTQVFLEIERRRFWLYVGAGAYLALLLAIVSGKVATAVSVAADGSAHIEYSALVAATPISWFFFIGFSVFDLVRQYRKTRNIKRRNKIRYPLLGVGAVILGVFANLTPLQPYPVDIAANLVSALLIGYAIVRHELFDLALLGRRSLAYATLTGAAAASYLALILVFERLVHDIPPPLSALDVALAILLTGLMAVLIRPILDGTKGRLDRLFFRERYDALQMVQRLGQQIAATLDRDRVLALLFAELSATLHVSRMAMLLKDPETGAFTLAARQDVPLQQTDLHWRPDHPVVRRSHRAGPTARRAVRTPLHQG